jgi:hypothetical protein
VKRVGYNRCPSAVWGRKCRNASARKAIVVASKRRARDHAACQPYFFGGGIATIDTGTATIAPSLTEGSTFARAYRVGVGGDSPNAGTTT